jgi:hypothetical protein
MRRLAAGSSIACREPNNHPALLAGIDPDFAA